MNFSKGYIDHDYRFTPGSPVAGEAKRRTRDLLRAQEHMPIAFVLDAKVPEDEAWCDCLLATWPRWRVHPDAIASWLGPGEIDWRHNEMTPEDFYAY